MSVEALEEKEAQGERKDGPEQALVAGAIESRLEEETELIELSGGFEEEKGVEMREVSLSVLDVRKWGCSLILFLRVVPDPSRKPRAACTDPRS